MTSEMKHDMPFCEWVDIEEFLALKSERATLAARVAELEGEAERLREDAERFYHLRDFHVRPVGVNPELGHMGSKVHFRFDHLRDETLEEAIDAARGAKEGCDES
jgi:hypothetical protein